MIYCAATSSGRKLLPFFPGREARIQELVSIMRGPTTSGTNYGGGLIRYLRAVPGFKCCSHQEIRDLSAVKSVDKQKSGI